MADKIDEDLELYEKIKKCFLEHGILVTDAPGDMLRGAIVQSLGVFHSHTTKAIAEQAERVTFDSVPGHWNRNDQHVRHVLAIQKGKIINHWSITDDELRKLFGEGPYGICQEQIEAFGLAQLQEESKT